MTINNCGAPQVDGRFGDTVATGVSFTLSVKWVITNDAGFTQEVFVDGFIAGQKFGTASSVLSPGESDSGRVSGEVFGGLAEGEHDIVLVTSIGDERTCGTISAVPAFDPGLVSVGCEGLSTDRFDLTAPEAVTATVEVFNENPLVPADVVVGVVANGTELARRSATLGAGEVREIDLRIDEALEQLPTGQVTVDPVLLSVAEAESA